MQCPLLECRPSDGTDTSHWSQGKLTAFQGKLDLIRQLKMLQHRLVKHKSSAVLEQLLQLVTILLPQGLT